MTSPAPPPALFRHISYLDEKMAPALDVLETAPAGAIRVFRLDAWATCWGERGLWFQDDLLEGSAAPLMIAAPGMVRGFVKTR